MNFYYYYWSLTKARQSLVQPESKFQPGTSHMAQNTQKRNHKAVTPSFFWTYFQTGERSQFLSSLNSWSRDPTSARIVRKCERRTFPCQKGSSTLEEFFFSQSGHVLSRHAPPCFLLATSLARSLWYTRLYGRFNKERGNLRLHSHGGCGVARPRNNFVTSHFYIGYQNECQGNNRIEHLRCF